MTDAWRKRDEALHQVEALLREHRAAQDAGNEAGVLALGPRMRDAARELRLAWEALDAEVGVRSTQYGVLS